MLALLCLALSLLVSQACAQTMAVATFSDSTCSSLSTLASYTTSGACTYSSGFGSYYQVTSVTSTTASYLFGCSDSTCTNCLTSGGPGTDGTCVFVGGGVYGGAWQIVSETLTGGFYSDPGCSTLLSGTTTTSFTSGECTYSSAAGSHFFVGFTTQGDAVYAFGCTDSTCDSCDVYGLNSNNACVVVNNGVYARCGWVGPSPL
jgi:hypothetical protein